MTEKIMKLSLLPVFASLVFYGCFSPYKGEEATLTLFFDSAAAAGGARAIWEPGKGQMPPSVVGELAHKVTLTGGSTVIERSYGKGTTSAKIQVSPGIWTVTVETFCYDVPIALGTATVTVTAGQDSPVPVTMEPQDDVDFYVVSDYYEWRDTFRTLGDRIDKDAVILITANISIEEIDYGFITTSVTICGDKKISLAGPAGSLLTIDAGGWCDLYDTKLQGFTDSSYPWPYTASLVTVNNGNFRMMGSSEIFGNTITDPSSYGSVNGGGVYVDYGGIFTMQDNASVHDNTAQDGGGGGVYINGGTFIMRDSASVSGNTANSGGGVYVADGTFELYGGSVYGNNLTTSPSPSGKSLYVSSYGTAKYGDGSSIISPGTFFTDADLIWP